MTNTAYVTDAEIKDLFAQANNDENLSPANGPDILILRRIGHTGFTCLGVAVECATENRADAGLDDDLYETYAEAANYILDGTSSCYCNDYN